MQRKTDATKLMHPSVYARLRGLNRSTISRQIRDGKIPIHDGKVDSTEADLAREHNLDQTRRRKVPPDSSGEPFPPLVCLGMEYLAKSLREEGRIEALGAIAVEATEIGITPDQASKAARMFAYMTSLWIEDLLGEAFGKKYARKFGRELAAWIDTWPKGGIGEVGQ